MLLVGMPLGAMSLGGLRLDALPLDVLLFRRRLDGRTYPALPPGGITVTVLVIASSKGGPGKTTLSALIVGTLATEGLPLVAIDADPTGGLYRWATKAYEGP